MKKPTQQARIGELEHTLALTKQALAASQEALAVETKTFSRQREEWSMRTREAVSHANVKADAFFEIIRWFSNPDTAKIRREDQFPNTMR